MNKKILIIAVPVISIGIGIFLSTHIKRAKSPGFSMSPTITSDSQIIYTDLLLGTFKAGDIILEKTDTGDIFIKRIGGVPGDKLSIKDGNLFINGSIFNFPGSGKVSEGSFLGENQTITVPQNSYFLISDNPEKSFDSRHFGFFNKDKIVGKVLLIK